MDLLCIKYDGWQPRIRPGTPRRQWMDDTNERYAYRCLPLTIANSHGWELLSPIAFEAKWDGGVHMESVEIRMDPGFADHLKPVSLFGYGTITWHVEAIFRTPPGWNLFVTAPPNRQKDAIQALNGMIETDWSPYTFTMNWRFTRANQWIRFEENEPIAFFFPVQRGSAERFKPRIERLEEHHELRAAFEKWSESRTAFQQWVQASPPDAPGDKWQKLYFRGLDADGRPGPADHQSKIRLPPFTFPDGRAMAPPEARACPMRSRPQPSAEAGNVTAASTKAAGNVLLNYGAGGGANPALSLALGRLNFDARPQQAMQVAVQPVARADRGVELAIKRRDWMLEVEARQRALSAREPGIVERVRDLSGDDFLEQFYAPSRPVIIEDAMADWPALSLWTPAYLSGRVGAAEIEYQGDREPNDDFDREPDQHRRTMPFDRFIAAIEAAPFSNDMGITIGNADANRAAFAPLEADMGTLDAWLEPRPGRIAIGPAGTFSPLKFDLANRLIAQIAGSQRILLAPSSDTRRLYPIGDTHSAVRDLTDEGQLVRYPLARGAQIHEVDLEAGDLLFVPVAWWMQSTAVDFSVTATYTSFRWPNDSGRDFPRE